MPGSWAVPAALFSALLLTHPLVWGEPHPALWAPGAGLGLAAVAWLGSRAGGVVLLAAGLVGLTLAAARDALSPDPDPILTSLRLALGGADIVFAAAEAPLSWWAFGRAAQGARRLSEPRSATLFLFVVPFLVVGLVALARAGLSALIPGADELGYPGVGFAHQLAAFWLERALGVLIVAPPLLVGLTPWLLVRGAIPAEPWGEWSALPGRAAPVPRQGAGGVPAPRWGDFIETVGLAAGASILCLLLVRLHGRRDLIGWQLWGVQLLLIVWASLRQGLRGGTLVASVAAAVPLVVLTLRGGASGDLGFSLLLQAHLVAQCSAALLVAGAAGWVRTSEAGYRQVVSHLPVVLYSAQFRADPGARAARGGSDVGLAEVTLVSAASAGLLGVTPEQLLGDYSGWLDRVHPDDREVVLAALAQLDRQDQPVICEYRLASSEGSSRRLSSPTGPSPPGGAGLPPAPARSRWLRDTLAPVRDPAGRLVGWEGVVTDITEQRALADDLRRTSSMFHALVANLPTGVFFVQGPHGLPILVNARARQLLGQREDASAGLDHLSQVYRLFRPDGTPYPVEELPVYIALRSGRTTMRDDIVVHRPDGRRIHLVAWAAPVLLGGRSAPDAAVWVLEDLTALRQAEAARQDTEGRLRAVVQTMAEGLIVQDRRGAVVDCNPAACAFLGQSPDGLRGQSPFARDWLFLSEDGTVLPAEDQPAEAALRTGRPVRNIVLGLRSASGAVPARPSSIRWVLVNAMPLGDPGAGTAPAGVVTTFSDLTAYVHAREAIRASEEKYRGLIESLPVMLIQADRHLRVNYVNPVYRATIGYDVEEIAEPADWARVVHPDDLGRLQEASLACLAGRPGRLELRIFTRDRTEKVVFALLNPRWHEGHVVGTTTTLMDVTRERQLEQELNRAQRLELIGRLSSGVAHDFNNLLGVVLNLTDLARGHLPAGHPAHADLQRISDASEQAVGLAGQLLALSRQRQARPVRVELNRAVRRTLELLRASLPSHVEAQADLTTDPLSVMADETQLQQVIMNLCINARDAMPEGGRLAVRTGRVEAPDRVYVLLTVSDTGKGILPEVLARIFEPFFSTKEAGTGLGLAVVQRIVEGAGGRIVVASEPGHGARFEIFWPAAEG